MVKYPIHEIPQNTAVISSGNGNKVIQLRLNICVYYLCLANSNRVACNQHNIGTKYYIKQQKQTTQIEMQCMLPSPPQFRTTKCVSNSRNPMALCVCLASLSVIFTIQIIAVKLFINKCHARKLERFGSTCTLCFQHARLC